jgi:3-deoxy-D-manno-octulosonic-acid transferase
MSRFFYSLALYLLLPFTPLKLLWRSIKQPEYRQHLLERYAFYQAKPQQPLIWLHCVSLGETRAAVPLIKALMQQHPQHRILLTHATPTGREAGEQLFGDQVDRVYLPYDTPDAVARFLNHFQPSIGLLMETELWFNLIAGCKARNIPILLVNARLSTKSARGYAKVANLTREGLGNLTAIAAQTDADAERLTALGAKDVSVCGNLKFDVKPPEDAAERGRFLRELLGKHRPVFLAASTRDGEEVLILDAVQQLDIPNLLTVIVPRHPQRFDQVAELLKKRGVAYCRRSELSQGNVAADIPGSSVILGDSMGEMFTYYAACDVAFIGGSLLPLGGQNLIEASIMAKPVLIGPHTFNFEQATEQAVVKCAAWRVQNVNELRAALQKLLGDSDMQARMAEAAVKFSQSATGASERIVDLVAKHLPG